MSSPTLDTSQKSNNPGTGPAILAVSWTLTAVAMAAVGFRFYLRKSFKIRLASDDWIMLIALALQIVYQVAATEAVSWGLGKPVSNLTIEQLVEMTKWSWMVTPFANMVSVLARISITILLVRLFSIIIWFKWFMIIFTGIQTVLGMINIIMVWAQCQPVQGLWDFRLQGVHCWDKSIQEGVTTTLQMLFALSDLIFVLFPVIFIWNLNLDIRKRLGLIVLMCLSLITMGAALSKVITNLIYRDINPFQGTEVVIVLTIQIMCTGIEQALVITIGCVPTLRPLARLSLEWFNAISSSLASLISSTRKRRDISEDIPYYRRPGHAGYEDLELRPSVTAECLRGDMVLQGPIVDISAQQGSHTPDSEITKHIRRTDNFSITYLQQTDPREDV